MSLPPPRLVSSTTYTEKIHRTVLATPRWMNLEIMMIKNERLIMKRMEVGSWVYEIPLKFGLVPLS